LCFASSFSDVGDWIIYAHSPPYLAYQGVAVTLYIIYVIYVVVRLALKFFIDGTFISIPVVVYVLTGLACLMRILNVGIDPGFNFHRLPYWGVDLTLWLVPWLPFPLSLSLFLSPALTSSHFALTTGVDFWIRVIHSH